METQRDSTRPYRVYVDTSVSGGCLDEGFDVDSRRLMGYAKAGIVTILMSTIVSSELADAPPEVIAIVEEIPPENVKNVPITDEVLTLRDAYLQAGVVGPARLDDAAHVAAATVARADAIVSWNFRHIVRLDKIRAYNRVNLLNGYGVLAILSPKEVRFDEPDES
jgi:hypothetical protein